MKLGVFYTALSGVLYGTIGYFGVRLSEFGLTVSDLLFWRFSISCVLLVPALLFVRRQTSLLGLKEVAISIFLGCTLYGFGTSLYFEAIRHIGTGLGMVIFFTYPIFVVLLSGLFHKQAPSPSILFALVLIVLGCFMIAFGDQNGFHADLWGIFLAAASGLGYALYIFASKSNASTHAPLATTFWVCLGSSLTFVLDSVLKQHSLYWPQSMDVWGLIFCFALIGTVLPICLFLMGMKTLSASQASIISVLEPVSVLIIGILVLGENVTTLQLMGAVIILSSAALALGKQPSIQQ